MTNSDRMSGAVRDAVGAARDVTRNMARRAGDAVDQGREKARGTMEAATLSVEGGMPHAGDEMTHERTAAGYL